MIKLHLIAAVSRQTGAIGYEGRLPWYKPDDLKVFQTLTQNTTIIVGKRTAQLLPELLLRNVEVWDGHTQPSVFLKNMETWGIKAAWLCGGEHTYRVFAGYVNGNVLINYVDYVGPYDSTFPFDAYGLLPPCPQKLT